MISKHIEKLNLDIYFFALCGALVVLFQASPQEVLQRTPMELLWICLPLVTSGLLMTWTGIRSGITPVFAGFGAVWWIALPGVRGLLLDLSPLRSLLGLGIVLSIAAPQLVEALGIRKANQRVFENAFWLAVCASFGFLPNAHWLLIPLLFQILLFSRSRRATRVASVAVGCVFFAVFTKGAGWVWPLSVIEAGITDASSQVITGVQWLLVLGLISKLKKGDSKNKDSVSTFWTASFGSLAVLLLTTSDWLTVCSLWMGFWLFLPALHELHSCIRLIIPGERGAWIVGIGLSALLELPPLTTPPGQLTYPTSKWLAGVVLIILIEAMAERIRKSTHG